MKHVKPEFSLRKTARILGLDHRQLGRESERQGFPVERESGGRKFYNPDNVKAWRAINVKQKSGQNATPQKPLAPDDPQILTLRNKASTGAEIAKAAVSIAAASLADAAEQGQAGAMVLDGVRACLESLRREAKAQLAIEKERRDLLPKDEVFFAIGQMVARSIKLLDLVGATLATEIEVWLATPEFMATTPDKRRLFVWQWYDRMTREKRELEQRAIRALQTGQTEDE